MDVTLSNENLPRLAFRITEAARILGTSRRTVERLLARGELHASKSIGRNRIIARGELERFLRESSQ